jgi:hypothetical protein
MEDTETRRDTERRRPKGTGSVQELAPVRYRLRDLVGADPVTGATSSDIT